MCDCSCLHWAQCYRGPLLHLILAHFSSLVSRKLTTCTSSTLQKACRQEEGSPCLLNISPFLFVLSRTAAGLTRRLLSYPQCIKFTLNPLLNTLSSAHLTQGESNIFQWQHHQSHMTFCQDIYIISMVPCCSLLEAPPAVWSSFFFLTLAQVETES